MRLTYCVLAFAAALEARAQLPAPVLPAGMGVNIHFVTAHEQDLDLIAAAGFKFVRMDFSWARTERNTGQYSWDEYDQLTTNLQQRGLRALYILDYSNALYEEVIEAKNPFSGAMRKTTASPQHPESVAAFARWAGAAAAHFRGRHVIWEIWNEPNIQFWAPKPDVQQYAALALATARAVREADPDATIVAPASSGFAWEFLETLFQSGVLQYLDAVSVHPYRDYARPPETATADYGRLRALIDKYAPTNTKRAIPILSGEWGYATHSKGLSLETQAAFAARQQLVNLLDDVPLSIWYDWKNDGPDPDEREHNFGVVFADLKPKPAYAALQKLARELSGYGLVKRLPLENDRDYVVLFANAAGARKLASWTVGEPHAVKVDVPTGNRSGASSFELQLGAVPQYTLIVR